MILDKITTFFDSLGGMSAIGGLIGGVIQRMRKKMSFKKFLGSLIVASFVGWTIGSILSDYFDLSEKVVYALCALSGVFSEDVLNEIEEIIRYVSDFVKKWLSKKVE